MKIHYTILIEKSQTPLKKGIQRCTLMHFPAYKYIKEDINESELIKCYMQEIIDSKGNFLRQVAIIEKVTPYEKMLGYTLFKGKPFNLEDEYYNYIEYK